MLSQADLTDALHDALRACDPPCTRFCQAEATIAENRYRLVHNGLGRADTDAQIVYAEKITGASKESLTPKLRAWVQACHRRTRLDLNAAMATGGPIQGGPVYRVGDARSETFKTRGASMLGWPWRWTDGSPA